MDQDKAYHDYLSSLFSNEPLRSGTDDDIRISLELLPQEAAQGITRIITFAANMLCPQCSGGGIKPVLFLPLTKDCRHCQGQGIVPCQKDFQLSVPAGTRDRDTLSFPGHGLYTSLKRSRGDLYIQIRIKPSSPMQRPHVAPASPFVAPQPSLHQAPTVAGQPLPHNPLTFRQEPTLVSPQRQAPSSIGNYRLLRLLGRGGFADVYLGEHQYLRDRQVAIKVLREHLQPQDVQEFLQEAQTIATLHHPHIVSILDCGVEGTNPYLVMTYASQGTLHDRHPKGSRLTLSTIIPYVRQVASALQYAHDHQFIHRDVKPENMLVEGSTVILSDFGIAVTAHSTKSINLHKQDPIGTVAYMAPEQINGYPRPASDQYSLAIIVYEWLCGERPFSGTTMGIAMHQERTPPPSLRAKMPMISPQVEWVILKALAKDPAQRFNSVQALAQALEYAAGM